MIWACSEGPGTLVLGSPMPSFEYRNILFTYYHLTMLKKMEFLHVVKFTFSITAKGDYANYWA